jgi:hypothetical protein
MENGGKFIQHNDPAQKASTNSLISVICAGFVLVGCHYNIRIF